MKRIYVSIAFILICFTVSGIEIVYISSKVENFTSLIDNAYNQMKKTNFEEAVNICTQTEEQWNNSVSAIDSFLIHDYVDKIGESISLMKTYAENCAPADYFAESKRAKKQLASIKESEYPIFENIV